MVKTLKLLKVMDQDTLQTRPNAFREKGTSIMVNKNLQ